MSIRPKIVFISLSSIFALIFVFGAFDPQLFIEHENQEQNYLEHPHQTKIINNVYFLV